MSELYFHIYHGGITNPPKVREAFNLPDGTYILTIRRFKKRTANQNQYYWHILVPAFKEGLLKRGYEVHTNEESHEVIKHLFLKKEITDKETGELIATIAGSTADLSTAEFNDLIDRAIRYAAMNLDTVIQYPNEQSEMFNTNH